VAELVDALVSGTSE